MIRLRSLSVVVSLAFTLNVVAQPRLPSIGSLRFLGGYEVPYNQPFKGTTIGGLSGIDYDAAQDSYFLICDDRSAIEPARFYSAKIHLSEKGIDTVTFSGVGILRQENGQPYPNSRQDRLHTPDPESIRYDAPNNTLVWTSEGERIVNQKDTILANPAITIVETSGKYAGAFQIPENLIMRKGSEGPRKNGALEALTFANDYSMMFAGMEEPLYQDGPQADLQPGNAWVRIYQFDMSSKKNIAQYAYPLDPVAYPANPPGAFKINGVPEILSIGDNKMLVIERSFSTGRLACTVKVFLADLSNATNVLSIQSLKDKPPSGLVTKKLLLNMNDLGIYIDNVEGVTVGPTLSNGHRTLVFVSDNNFEIFEKTQLLLFEVIP
jgi:hypothetical protein